MWFMRDVHFTTFSGPVLEEDATQYVVFDCWQPLLYQLALLFFRYLLQLFGDAFLEMPDVIILGYSSF